MSVCYIIYSRKIGRFYCGVTNKDAGIRIGRHNAAEYGGHRFTAKANDWELFLTIQADDYPHAVRMERKIKSMKSATYIRNLKEYIGLRQKLVEATRKNT